MKRIHGVVISIVLVALLGLMACAPGWGLPGQSGMMGGQGGMMGPGMMSGQGGMMGSGVGGDRGNYNSDAEPLTIDQAAEAVEDYLHAYWRNLALVEVMEFAWNFYAEVEEEDTGIHAMELLIDKSTGQVSPEMGPNMMWNTKYGMHSYSPDTALSNDMPIAPEPAERLAQQFLDANLPGITTGEAETFYGYYTLHTLKDEQIEGMLSVNGYTGAVWYHNWHGSFIGMEEFHDESESGH